MAMRKCKECGEMIATSAKTCPKCGAKQPMKVWLKILIGFIIVTIIAGIGGGVSSNRRTSPKKVKVGDTFYYEDFEITVNTIDKKNAVGTAFDTYRAEKGTIYLCVKWKFKNISDKPITMFDRPDLVLFSPKGYEFEDLNMLSIAYRNEIGVGTRVLDDVNPGITINDGSVFEVSVDDLKVKGWVLKVKEKMSFSDTLSETEIELNL